MCQTQHIDVVIHHKLLEAESNEPGLPLPLELKQIMVRESISVQNAGILRTVLPTKVCRRRIREWQSRSCGWLWCVKVHIRVLISDGVALREWASTFSQSWSMQLCKSYSHSDGFVWFILSRLSFNKHPFIFCKGFMSNALELDHWCEKECSLVINSPLSLDFGASAFLLARRWVKNGYYAAISCPLEPHQPQYIFINCISCLAGN